MGMTNAPTQFGIWIAFQNSIGSIDESIKRLKAAGASWVAPRAGEGGWRDKEWSPEKAKAAIAKYHAAGIKVYPWVYSRPSSYLAEVKVFKALVDEGADGVFIDAEIEWQGAGGSHKPAAALFMQALRKELGEECFIAHAPFPYVQWHLDFPYVEFGTYCDAVADQLYWTEINDAGARSHIDKTSAQWAQFLKAHPEGAKLRCPIGCTYGNELKGVLKGPPGKFRALDLEVFVKWCQEQCFPFYSVYSLDAACSEATVKMQELAGSSNPACFPPSMPASDDVESPAINNWEMYREVVVTGDVTDAVVQLPEEDVTPAPAPLVVSPTVSVPWFIVLFQFIAMLIGSITGKRR